MASAVDRRRRFAKACDDCRRRKLRCDGVRPCCSRCRGEAAVCQYTDVNKPASSRRRHAYPGPTESPQHGIPQIAGTSEPAAVPGYRSDVCDPAAADGLHHVHQDLRIPDTRGASSVDITPPPQAQETSISPCSPLSQEALLAGNRDLRYFGPSSGASLVPAATPALDSRQSIHNGSKSAAQEGNWSTWTHPALAVTFERRVHKKLPPWSQALALVKEFFDEEHTALPLFHEPSFMILLGRQYSDRPPDNPAWWASINAVLAIATRRRAEQSQETSTESDAAWGYAANALGAVLEIMMRNTQLISVQALLIIAVFFIGTPNPQPSFMLTGSALRLAHSIGLHKGNCDLISGPVEKETGNRVFWCALALDRYICFRTGRPSAQDSSDFQVDLPKRWVEDGSGDFSGADGLAQNVLHASAGLAVIQGCVYGRLYSSEALAEQSASVSSTVTVLDKQLEEWSSSVRPDFDPGEMTTTSSHPALLRLHYTYYNCVIAIHRAPGRQYWMPFISANLPPQSSSLSESIQRCSRAARQMVELLDLIPSQLKSFCWEVLPFNSNALVILSIDVLRQPNSKDARKNLLSVEKIIRHFTTLRDERPGSFLARLMTICEELYDMARRAVSSGGRSEVESEAHGTVTGPSTLHPTNRQSPPDDVLSAEVGWEAGGDRFATIREIVGTSLTNPALRPVPQNHDYLTPAMPNMQDQMGQGFLNHLLNPWYFDEFLTFDSGMDAGSQDNTSWG